jgi:hypothetical protein
MKRSEENILATPCLAQEMVEVCSVIMWGEMMKDEMLSLLKYNAM